MTNKIATKILTYKLGSPSYGDLNSKNRKDNRQAVFNPDLWQTGFF